MYSGVYFTISLKQSMSWFKVLSPNFFQVKNNLGIVKEIKIYYFPFFQDQKYLLSYLPFQYSTKTIKKNPKIVQG